MNWKPRIEREEYAAKLLSNYGLRSLFRILKGIRKVDENAVLLQEWWAKSFNQINATIMSIIPILISRVGIAEGNRPIQTLPAARAMS
jgi:hypothetical protein